MTTSTTTLANMSSSADHLVVALLDRQDRLENAQGRFMRFQLAMNAITLNRSNRLALTQKRLEGQIVAGKAALVALEHSLDKEIERVSELENVVSTAEAELEKVKFDLSLLEKTIQEQSDQLSKQGSEIQRLSVSKVQREALVEALLFLTTLAAIRSSIVNLPISTLLLVFPKRSRITTATRSFARFMLFLVLLRRIRSYAVQTGWTSENASLYDYLLNVSMGKV